MVLLVFLLIMSKGLLLMGMLLGYADMIMRCRLFG
jgi:hypothetical protein